MQIHAGQKYFENRKHFFHVNRRNLILWCGCKCTLQSVGFTLQHVQSTPAETYHKSHLSRAQQGIPCTCQFAPKQYFCSTFNFGIKIKPSVYNVDETV